MRNDSSAPRARCSTFFALLTALFLAGFSSSLHAQCSDQDDPGSVDCQLQQPVNTSTPTGESPAALSLTQSQQQQPRADRSNEATANGSLSTGST